MPIRDWGIIGIALLILSSIMYFTVSAEIDIVNRSREDQQNLKQQVADLKNAGQIRNERIDEIQEDLNKVIKIMATDGGQ
jgi:sensor domain CHASE-containing protein